MLRSFIPRTCRSLWLVRLACCAADHDVDEGNIPAGQYQSTTYPESGSVECGAPFERHVCDPTGIMKATELSRERVVTFLQDLDQGPLFPCGDGPARAFQVGVALLERVAPGEDVKAFAEGVFNRWGVGHPECHNGVLLVLARKDRTNYIKTGPGAREVLTDNHASDILESLRPELLAGAYGAAVEHAVYRMADEALRHGRPPMFYKMDLVLWGSPSLIWRNPVPTVFAIIVAAAVIGMCAKVIGMCAKETGKARRQIAFEDKLRRLQKAREALSKRGDCRHGPCPICFDQLPSSPELNFESGLAERGAELLRCGHVFHEACVRKWISSRRGATCPMCREPIMGGAGQAPQRPEVAAPTDVYWHSAFNNLATEYDDVPGVRRMRREARDARGFDCVADWMHCYRLSAAEDARVAAAQAQAPAWRESGGNSGGTCSGGGWGGGSCNGGGGAGGSW